MSILENGNIFFLFEPDKKVIEMVSIQTNLILNTITISTCEKQHRKYFAMNLHVRLVLMVSDNFIHFYYVILVLVRNLEIFSISLKVNTKVLPAFYKDILLFVAVPGCKPLHSNMASFHVIDVHYTLHK
jgi:hypothetical protein